MKTDKMKKIFAGIGIGLTIAGSGFMMTGCTITPEQQKALDAITNNTETLVDSFNSYLDGQNNKLDKETAYDMLKHARIKSQYILDESNICEINVKMTDELSSDYSFEMNGVFDFSTDIKKMMVVQKSAEEESLVIGNYNLEDVDKSYMADYVDGLPVLAKLDECWYRVNLCPNIDALAQAGIREIDIDDITRVTVNQHGEFIFNVIKTRIMKIGETDYTQIINFAEIVVKDYLFKRVSVQNITKTGSDLSFDKNMNGEYIPDGYGSYAFSGNIEQVIRVNAEYRYGNDVILTDMNAKISELDEKIASGELIIPQE